MIFIINNILAWVLSLILAVVLKCYDGWYIKPFFDHPEIPFIAYLGIVMLFRALSIKFDANDYNAATQNIEKTKKSLIPATVTLITCNLVTLFWGWVLHFFI